MKSDVELVEASREGDRQAFGHIVERYQALVCGVAYSSVGDLALSQDLAQETFLAAWQGVRGLREPSKLRAWLCGIARNLAKGALRRQAGRAGSASEPALDQAVSREPSPLEQTLAKEEEALLWRALGGITPEYREPLVLYYREERSVAQVAAALEISEAAAKQRLARGRAMLEERVAVFVEQALGRSRPGTAFTVAVLAALPGLVPQASAAGVVAASHGSAAAKSAAVSAAGAGAVLGPLLGVLGAVAGASASIRNTRSLRERQYMVRMTWLFSFVALGFAAAEALGIWLLPGVFRTLSGQLGIVSVYSAGLVWAIVRTNRRQREIQVEEGTFVEPRLEDLVTVGASKAAVYASLGGGVFGSVAWVFPLAWMAGDWLTALCVLAFSLALFLLAARACLRAPERYFRVSTAVVVAVGVLNLTVIALRWEPYMAVYRLSRFYSPASDLPLWAMELLMLALIAWLLLSFRAMERRSSSGRSARSSPGPAPAPPPSP